jgi:hypothetical protein
MRGQRREGRTPSVEPELRFGSHTAVVFYPLILLKSHYIRAAPRCQCSPMAARRVEFSRFVRPFGPCLLTRRGQVFTMERLAYGVSLG